MRSNSEVRTSKLLGIKINYPCKKDQLKESISAFISSGGKNFIFTVNPEFIVDANYDRHFKEILNKASFNSADGIGVVMALKYQEYLALNRSRVNSLLKVYFDLIFKNLAGERLAGVEIVELILEYSNSNSKSVFLLGGDSKKQVSERLNKSLEKKFPNIVFAGSSSNFSSKELDDTSTINYITGCMKKKDIKFIDFLLVGYGHPSQEKWINRNAGLLNTKVFVGVGGSFDFLLGHKPRAPKFLRNFGLEWLFRLIHEPSRLLRIWKATVSFSYLILKKIK